MVNTEFKIALVVPLHREKAMANNLVEYLGYASLAAYLEEEDYSVDLIDAYVEDYSPEKVAELIQDGGYRLVGFTLMSSNFLQNMQKILKSLPKYSNNNLHITVGGYYASMHQEDVLNMEERIDSLVVGEGERTLFQLVKALDRADDLHGIPGLIYRDGDRLIHNPQRPLLTEEELTQLPSPDHRMLPKVLAGQGVAQMLSSRGCFGGCAFCGVQTHYHRLIGKKWRGLDSEVVVSRMQELIQSYGVEYIYFADEEFVGPGPKGQERAQQIAKLIIEQRIKVKFCIYCRVDSISKETFALLQAAGLDRVFLGVEFGVQKLLDFYHKGVTVEDNVRALEILYDLDIKISVGYIMFEPMMTLEDFRENLAFYREYICLQLRHLVTKMAIYPGSKLFDQVKDQLEMDQETTFEWLLGDHYLYHFKFSNVEFLYKLLLAGLPVISPSKGYQKIVKQIPTSNQHQWMQRWEEGVIDLVDQLAIKLQTETDFSDAQFTSYNSWFVDTLVNWDIQFAKRLGA